MVIVGGREDGQVDAQRDAQDQPGGRAGWARQRPVPAGVAAGMRSWAGSSVVAVVSGVGGTARGPGYWRLVWKNGERIASRAAPYGG